MEEDLAQGKLLTAQETEIDTQAIGDSIRAALAEVKE